MARDPKPHRGEVKRGSVLLNIIEVEGSWGIMAPLKKCYRKYHGIQVNSSGSKDPDFSWILCWGHVEIWLAWVNRKQRAWDLGGSYWPWEIGSGKPLAQGQKDRVVGSRYANVFWLIKASGHCSQGSFWTHLEKQQYSVCRSSFLLLQGPVKFYIWRTWVSIHCICVSPF